MSNQQKKDKRPNRRDEKLDFHSFRGAFREGFLGTSGEHLGTKSRISVGCGVGQLAFEFDWLGGVARWRYLSELTNQQKKDKRPNRRDEKLDFHNFRGAFREGFLGMSGDHLGTKSRISVGCGPSGCGMVR